MFNKLQFYLFTTILIFVMISNVHPQNIQRYNVGYFEAGQYDIHSILRDEYFKQLEHLLPENMQLVTIPEGYRSADWNRDKSKKMAKQLADIKHLDFIIALGPWVVQDLLEAGFEKPIIGMHQFNPKAEGLIDANNRPIADNLTVHFRPSKIVDDISLLTKIIPIRKLGLLYFPSDDTTNSLYEHVYSLGKQFGFEVITATEYDNEGTFAFFKSYNKIRSKRVDAIYLPPLWGLDSKDLTEFFLMLDRDKVPSFTDEGSLLIQHGATMTNNYFGIVSEAYFNATKTVKILNGSTPADLLVVFRSGHHIALNKKSLEICNIDIRADLYNSYQTFGVVNDEETPVSQLPELVHRAISQNPQILSFDDKLQIAESKIDITKSALRPQVSTKIELDYIDNNFRHNYRDYLDKNTFRASVDISQTLFSLETLKSIQSDKKLKKITQISKLSEQLDLELAVSLAYIDYLQIGEQIDLIQNLRSMVSYNLEILYAKQTIENSDSLDYIRLENYRYSLTLDFIKNNRLLQTTQVIINSLLNLPPDDKFLLQTDYFSEKQFIEYESPIISKLQTHSEQANISTQLLQKMLQNAPNQSNSDAVIAYHKSILNKNKAAFYPEFKLHGSLLYDDRQQETNFFQEKRPS